MDARSVGSHFSCQFMTVTYSNSHCENRENITKRTMDRIVPTKSKRALSRSFWLKLQAMDLSTPKAISSVLNDNVLTLACSTSWQIVNLQH